MPITPFLLFLSIPLPCQCLCWQPRKEDLLEKAVGSGKDPVGVNEDSSTDT